MVLHRRRFDQIGAIPALRINSSGITFAITFAALMFGCGITHATQPSYSGLNLAIIDRNVDPATDIWSYSNGKWLANTKIPSDESEWGVNEIIDLRTQKILRKIAETAAADRSAPGNSVEGEVGSFYRSAVDENAIQSSGYIPVQSELARIDTVSDNSQLIAEIGRLHRLEVGAAFEFTNEQDPGNSDAEIASVGQGGIGLPEPGYYIRTDSDTIAIRAAYVQYIIKTFTALGDSSSTSTADATTVLSLETKLAVLSKSPDELRDPVANYHKMSMASLQTLTPGIDWQSYFDALHLTNRGPIDVNQPEFFIGLEKLLNTIPLDEWKTYLTWSLVNTEAPRLSKAFDAPNFEFYGTLLNGTPKEQPRWKRAVEATDAEIGDALGQLYVAKYFPPSAKAHAVALVLNLKSVLRDDISLLPWMSQPTRLAALKKIDAMTCKVGYPDHWRDYSTLDLSGASYAVNCMRADELNFQHDLNEIGRPVDRSEWGMTAPTNNAYYDPSNNSINFPAGILQPPFFSSTYDDAVNYGEIGATIGHEMTHGFDDQGRQFDYHGNLHNWWTLSDLKQFNLRKAGIVSQYSHYEPIPGQYIDGNLTTGENIADIGGLKIAYLAYERSLKGKLRTVIDGYTPEQRFFIAYAQSWLEKERPAVVSVLLKTDPHSPPRFRVVGVISDTPEFYLAFPGRKPKTGSSTTIW